MRCTWIIIALIFCSNCSTDNPINTMPNIAITGVVKSETLKVDDGEEVYTIVDEMPRLTGCGDAFDKKTCSERKLLQYLYSKVEYDSIALVERDFETSIVFSVVIEKDGTVSNFEFVKGTESKWNVRSIVESMPLWLPGKLKGVPKRVKMHIPMRLRFE